MAPTDSLQRAHPVLFNVHGQTPALKHPWRRRILFGGFVLARAIVRWLPMPVGQVFGRLLGYLAYAGLRPHRARAYANIRQALGPSASHRTCRDVVRGVFVNLGKLAPEWFVLDRYAPGQIRRAVEIRGLAHLQKALAHGCGVIALSAHFGNWEVLPMALASAGFQGGVLARRLRYAEYEQFLIQMRRRKGVATLARGSVTEAVRLLNANRILGVLPDQDIDSLDGVFVDFFNQPAYTPSGPAALSLMTGAPIVPCFVVRTGRRFRVVIEEPLEPAKTGDRTRDVIAMTQQWSRIVESYIRAYPDQWAWVHPRWKTPAPAGPAPARTGPTRSVESPATPDTSSAAGRVPPRSAARSGAAAIAVGLLLGLCAAGCSGSGARDSTLVQTPPVSKPAEAPTHNARFAEANQQLDTFTMTGYAADGTRKWDLNGHGAMVDGPFVTVKQPAAVGYGLADDLDVSTAMPRSSTINASVAQIEQATRRIRMEHDVALRTSDGLWMFSPLLYWLPDESRLTTDTAVRIETDHMLVRGYGGSGQTQLKQAVIERDVEMVLNPSPEDIPGGNSHVQISCDGPLAFDYERNIATFEDNVHIKDDQGDLYSDKLIAHLDRATHTVRYAEAIGHVRILQHGNEATGERAIYQPALGKVTLLGAPSLVIEDADNLNTHAVVPMPSSVPMPGAPAAADTAGGKTEAMADALGDLERSPGDRAGTLLASEAVSGVAGLPTAVAEESSR